jgi:hypothetical protein
MQKNKVAFSHRLTTPREQAERIKEDFDWCCQMLELLGELANVLSGTVGQFSSFFTTDAGILQFHDTGTSAISTDACRRLIEIKQAFRQLETRQQRISCLKDVCIEARVLVSSSWFFFCVQMEIRNKFY